MNTNLPKTENDSKTSKTKKQMKQYTVTVRFTFEGTFKVKATNRMEACKHVEEDCGLVLGGNIHSTLPDEEVNWDFPIHPEKQLVHIS